MNYIASILCITLGIKIFISKNFSGRGIDINLSQNYLYIIIGIFFISLGFLIIYATIKDNKNPKPQTEHTICPTCKQTYNFTDLKDGKCPTCDIDTIEIEHYYKDNPFKEDEKE